MIIQTNTWICENCEKIESTSEETDMYSDPVVTPPKDRAWAIEPKKDMLFCPECLRKESN